MFHIMQNMKASLPLAFKRDSIYSPQNAWRVRVRKSASESVSPCHTTPYMGICIPRDLHMHVLKAHVPDARGDRAK